MGGQQGRRQCSAQVAGSLLALPEAQRHRQQRPRGRTLLAAVPSPGKPRAAGPACLEDNSGIFGRPARLRGCRCRCRRRRPRGAGKLLATRRPRALEVLQGRAERGVRWAGREGWRAPLQNRAQQGGPQHHSAREGCIRTQLHSRDFHPQHPPAHPTRLLTPQSQPLTQPPPTTHPRRPPHPPAAAAQSRAQTHRPPPPAPRWRGAATPRRHHRRPPHPACGGTECRYAGGTGGMGVDNLGVVGWVGGG